MSKETDHVTLTRAEYGALLERIEDAEDNAFLDTVEVRERAIGKDKVRADYLPAELVRRLMDGEHPVRVWRAHRGLTRERSLPSRVSRPAI
jgi:ribosome-binding ATPase YchF (GTP1/OBG family)